MENKLPAWYTSSQGPQISMTVKSIALLLLPVLKSSFGIEVGTENVDAIVDALMIIIIGALAVYGYKRSKKNGSIPDTV